MIRDFTARNSAEWRSRGSAGFDMIRITDDRPSYGLKTGEVRSLSPSPAMILVGLAVPVFM